MRYSKLLYELQFYGISGQLIKWINSFLSDISQQTHVDYSLSSISKMCSGVIKGSVIIPLLFIIVINDITQICNDNKIMCMQAHAYYSKLYTVLHANEDCGNVQDKLNAIMIGRRTGN